jgi:WD40 repeat protein
VTSIGAVTIRAASAPFPGLRSFSRDESEFFFGREGQSDELALKLGQSRFVAVVGTSGSGKSSLVRAGLLPSLDSGSLVKAGSNWRIVDMRPGSRPIDNLAAALDASRICATLADPGALRGSSLALLDFASQAYQEKWLNADENVLLLVDQFEELFRYPARDMSDRDEKAAFVKLLLEVSKQRTFPFYVVITMRSDFLGDCACFRDLPETINAGQYLIPRMTRDQRREAIEGPIHMAGGAITPRLIQRVLNDVGEAPDQLPLMQHALMRTWYHWRNKAGGTRAVDIEDYKAVGALDNALSDHVDKAYAEASCKLPERGAQIVKRIFQCLRERDASGRETRRPTSLSELCAVAEASEEEVLAILECFRREGRSFLMPPSTVDLKSDREVDITHESLLRQWKRLQGPPTHDSGWLTEEEESRRTIVRLADRAEQQVQGNPDYLRGPLLQLALDWWNKRKPTEVWAKRYTPSFQAADAYLHGSEENRKRELEQEEERTRAEEAARLEQARHEQELKEKQRKARAAYFLAVWAIVVSMAAISGILYVYHQKQLAQEATANLEALKTAQKLAKEHRDAEESARQTQAEAEKTAEAVKDADNAKKARLATSVQLLASKAALAGTEGETQLPLGMLLAAESMRRQPLTDNESVLSKGLPLLPMPLKSLPDSNLVDHATFSKDGLLVTSEPGTIRVWDPKTPSVVMSFSITGSAGSLAVSSNGNRLVVAYEENGRGVVQGFDLLTGSIVGEHFTKPGTTRYVILADDGAVTALTQDTTSQLWTLRHWKDWSDEGSALPENVEKLFTEGSGAIAFSSDQKSVATYDRKKGQITVESFPILDPAKSHEWSLEEQTDIIFDPSDSNRLATFNANGIVKIWNVKSKLPVLLVSAGPMTYIEFSADGRLFATRRVDGVIRVWDSRDGREVGRVFAQPGSSGDVALDTHTGTIVVPQQGGPKLWRLAGVMLPEPIISAQIAGDGTLAMLGVARTAFPWDIRRALPKPRLDSSVINTFLGVSPDLRQIGGLCEKGQQLCIANLENGTGVINIVNMGELIQKFPDNELSGAIFTSPLLFSGDGRFVAGSIRRYTRTGLAASVLIWDAKAQNGPTILPVRDAKAQSPPTDLPPDNLLLGFTPKSDFCIISESVRSRSAKGPKNENPKNTIKLWDLNERGFSSSVPAPFLRQPASFVFSQDGKWLATSNLNTASAGTAEQSYTVTIWHWPEAKQPVKTLEIDTKVNRLEFSGDDRLLLTAGDELFIRVWDVSSGNEIGRVGTLRPILAMSFTDNDRQVVVFDQYSVTASYWRPGDLMREACQRIERSLSEQEWKKYLLSEPYFPTCRAFLTNQQPIPRQIKDEGLNVR